MMWWIIALAVLGIAAAAIVMPFGRALDLAKTRIDGASQVLNSPYGAIEFAASGDGPVVLVVHGVGGGFDQGLTLGANLASRGFRVVAPSRFGHLRSDCPENPTPAAQADAFAFLLRGLGVERTCVLAVSAGAPAAMQFALRHPRMCAALALVSPLAHDPAARSERPARGFLERLGLSVLLRSSFVFWAVLKLAPDVLVRELLGTDPEQLRAAAPEEKRRVLATLRNVLPVAARASGIANDRRLARSLEPYPLDKIASPVLVVSCEDDRFGTFTGARHAASSVQRGRFIGYARGGHIWAGHNDEVWLAVEAFFRAQLSPAAAAAEAAEPGGGSDVLVRRAGAGG